MVEKGEDEEDGGYGNPKNVGVDATGIAEDMDCEVGIEELEVYLECRSGGVRWPGCGVGGGHPLGTGDQNERGCLEETVRETYRENVEGTTISVRGAAAEGEV